MGGRRGYAATLVDASPRWIHTVVKLWVKAAVSLSSSSACSRQGHECVFPKEAVALIGIWFLRNCGCDDATVERFIAWQPDMEAVPTDCEPLPPVVNPGKEGFGRWFERSEDWPTQACRDPMGPQTFAEVRALDPEDAGGEHPANAEGPPVGQR